MRESVANGNAWGALPVQSADSKAFQSAVVASYQKAKQMHVTGKQQFAANKARRRETRKQKKASAKAVTVSDRNAQSSSGAMRRQKNKNKAKAVY